MGAYAKWAKICLWLITLTDNSWVSSAVVYGVRSRDHQVRTWLAGEKTPTNHLHDQLTASHKYMRQVVLRKTAYILLL